MPQRQGTDDSRTCTWVVYPTVAEEPAHICDRKAVAMFRQKNRKKGPGEPTYHEYPRCKVHFTEKAIGRAGLEGYDIVELQTED